MYFNRWSAFQQAKASEKEQDLYYSWFIHTRLDMAFGAPIPSISHWSTTFENTQYICSPSDSYFSMDLFVQESAMCLGGPNFNNATVKDSMLLRLGFDEGERKMIHVIKCKNSMDGWSEQIYKRILKLARISLGLNIGFTLIFSVILRKRPLPMPASLYVFWSAMGISAIKFSYLRWLCSFRTRISDGRRQLKNAVHFLSWAIKNTEEMGCTFSKNISGWNYMPYCIRFSKRFGGSCLTAT